MRGSSSFLVLLGITVTAVPQLFFLPSADGFQTTSTFSHGIIKQHFLAGTKDALKASEHQTGRRVTTTALSAADSESETNNEENSTNQGRAVVSLTGITSMSNYASRSTTSIIDSILSTLTSDIASIILGLLGLCLALFNRLSSIDYEATSLAQDASAMMGMQSRSDLLAVFASGAVLLNGISKLDVTSVLAESVVLEGETLTAPILDTSLEGKEKEDLNWGLESALTATPASTAAILLFDSQKEDPYWVPVAMSGVVPSSSETKVLGVPLAQRTPILDRFLNQKAGATKESYLPTLQALPGKVEFTYLPTNTQEALLLPILVGESTTSVVLALGSDTAKSFSPRDIAWCQVLASRMGEDFPFA